jgi:hypothetical protein
VTRTKTSTSTALASAETTTLPSSAKTSDADPGTGLSWAVNDISSLCDGWSWRKRGAQVQYNASYP